MEILRFSGSYAAPLIPVVAETRFHGLSFPDLRDQICVGGTLRFYNGISKGAHLRCIEALLLNKCLQAEDAVVNRLIELEKCFKCVEAQAIFLSSVAFRIRWIVMALLPVAVAISRSDMPFFRIAANLSLSRIALGRPSTFPSALALVAVL